MTSVASDEPLKPGFLVLHSNRLESLRDILVQWLAAYPLAPLEDEVVLVQSNGMAQWLKAALAADVDAEPPGLGICAAVSMQFPARFFWQAYRAVLGADAVPKSSPFDKDRLRWRILRLLPTLLNEPDFSPLHQYLADDNDGRKHWQLAVQLADLFDQYQVYRADWLSDWSQGLDVLRPAPERTDAASTLPERERWQAQLWRAIEMDVAGEEAMQSGQAPAFHRANLQARFVAALQQTDRRPPGLPRRVIVWGFSTLPGHVLEGLAALGQHVQVILAVVNPCRHYWADLLAARPRPRHARKLSLPARISEYELGRYANPLLLAWGQQGRDYLRRLESFDDPDAYRARFQAQGQRIDLFSDDEPGQSLLAQVQYAILDLQAAVSEPERRLPIRADDQSLRFQIAHSRLREVEALQDYLLATFEDCQQRGQPLLAQDVVVMVPDIRDYAPLIEAVFASNDERRLPLTILDRPQRSHEPLLAGLEWLLALPSARCTSAELWDLLDVPAIRARFGLGADDLPRLRYWFEAAGARWGLSGEHRGQWQMPVELAQNTWRFALERLLLGYAVGDAVAAAAGEGQVFAEVLPFADLSPLEATSIGLMTSVLDALVYWADDLQSPRTAQGWGETLRVLLDAFFLAQDDHERLLLEQVQLALDEWLAEAAETPSELTLAVVRESWLASLDESSMSQRFLSGAIHVGTLMPMRAIPFRVVCILGLNDGEFPRQRPAADFDLMSLKAHMRAGDRSRRDDDRYLFLEAMLSAREQLLLSWVGRSARSNQVRPPSLLVSQLQDYVQGGWVCDGQDVLPVLTSEHGLQPFSERYFTRDSRSEAARAASLHTYARHWREALDTRPPSRHQTLSLPTELPPLSLIGLRQWLRDPARVFYRERLGVVLREAVTAIAENEPFAVSGLDLHSAAEDLLVAACETDAALAMRRVVSERPGRGEWPLAGFAEPVRQHLQALAESVWDITTDWRASQADGPRLLSWHGQVDGCELALEEVLQSVRRGSDGQLRHWCFTASRLHDGKGRVTRWYPLLEPWLNHVLLALSGQAMPTRIVSASGCLDWPALSTQQAGDWWQGLLHYWLLGLGQALPFEARTAFAYAASIFADSTYTDAKDADGRADQDAQHERAEQAAHKVYEGSAFGNSFAASQQAPMSWIWPDFAALSASGDFAEISHQLFLPIVAATLGSADTEAGT